MTASRIPKSRRGWAAFGSKGKLMRFEADSGASKNALPKRNLEAARKMRAMRAREVTVQENSYVCFEFFDLGSLIKMTLGM